jgi:hypothetical protein
VLGLQRHRWMTFGNRRGGMLLEVLLVIGICLALLTILLPGMMTARLAARRISCLNNMKNVGLALHNYEQLHGVFPPGYVSRDVEPNSPAREETGPGWAWGTMILPSLDQFPLASTIDFSANASGATSLIPAYTCPEDAAEVFGVFSDRMGSVSLPPTNFVGVFGYGSMMDSPGAPASPGMFYRNSRVRIDDVHDGLSQTLMIGERRHRHELADGTEIDSPSTWYAAIPGVDREAYYPQSTAIEGPASLVLGSIGQDTPCLWHATPDSSPVIAGFSSIHDEGAHFVRADGSAGLIRRDIDYDVFRRLGQRSDSVLPPPQF